MRILSLFALSMLTTSSIGAEIPFYIGTYTSEDGSRGIYRAVLDTESGTIAEPTLAVETPGPSFLALSDNGRFLYAVHETAKGVGAFAVQPDGSLRLLNTQSSHGDGPCHVSLDQTGTHVFVANYGGGNLACLPIADDGSVEPASTVFDNTGSGPDKRRQEKPHLHAILPSHDNRFVYACDLGTDELLVFAFDAKAGRLTSAEPRSAKVPAGGGPRHLALHSSGRFVFVNNEMGNSVTVFDRDRQSGECVPRQTLSTLPDGNPVPGNSTAEIMLHPGEKWLYVSNRGHDSIAVYAVGDDGRLSLVEIASAGVAVPRGFGIDPSGKWLIAAGQKSNTITALAIDPSTGRLTPGPNTIEVGSPVNIVFAKQ